MLYILQKLLIFSIPLRELAGFKNGIPFRVGEILMLIYGIYIFLNTSIEKKIKFFNKSILSKSILYLLITNLILTIIFSIGKQIVPSFLIRYLLRNIMIIMFIFAILVKPLKIKRKDIELFFKYMVLIQLFMLILQNLGFTIKLFHLVSYPMGRRFQGTASEAGYLPALIVPALCYFRNSIKNKKYYYLAFFEIFITFSSFAYAALALELLIVALTKKVKINPKIFLKGIVAGLLILIIIGLNFKTVTVAVEKNFTKIIAYSKNDGGDFSSRARNQQLTYIKNEISKFNKEELLFGKGTGSYFYNQLKQIKKNYLMEITEEAHNIYYSTLHDRGIIGLILILGIFGIFGILIYKQRKNKVVMSLGYLYLLQLVHWKITANMWLYYFWISMAFVMSQYEIKEMRKNRRKNVFYKAANVSLSTK
ncbi:MAG: O-antigen ligase family protein [Fusobacteriaceae bacterium]